MEDFFADLYDDENNDAEPSFSLYEFKKWLSKQKDTEKDKLVEREDKEKDELKEKFKERFKAKLKKKKHDRGLDDKGGT